MIQRLVHKELVHRLKISPAVALLGPRQCGKTTLARSLGGLYFDLEQESERLRLDLEWPAISAGTQLIILDEAQSWPDIFPRLRGAIDADRKRNGRFLLLGSISPSLMMRVSESLAGRLSLVELTPFLLPELPHALLDRLWLCGGFPDGGILTDDRYPRWELDYLAILTQRDLPLWGLPAKPEVTHRLLRMLAAVQGQSWNGSQLGQSMGLDSKTINTYLDYLVGTFLIRRLQPYQTNIKKRLVKSPKVYWRDAGLLHALLNVSTKDILLTQPWVGASWEGFVIEQAIGILSAMGKHFDAYYFRTNDQYEIDLVLDFGKNIWAIEIKLTTAPTTHDMDRLDKAADLIGAQHRFLVSRTLENVNVGNRHSCDLAQLLEHLADA